MATLGTFTAGQVLTAAELNDIGNMTAYTPTLTNFTASTVSAAYAQVNDLVFISYYFVVSAVTGYVQFSTPSGQNISVLPSNQTGAFLDVGAGYYVSLLRFASTTAVYFTSVGVGATYATEGAVGATTPFTWASGDVIEGGFWYRRG